MRQPALQFSPFLNIAHAIRAVLFAIATRLIVARALRLAIARP